MLPIIGAIGRTALGGLAKKAAGKALRWATRGRLIGQGGGREIVRRAGQAAGGILTAGTAVSVGRDIARARRERREQMGPEDYEVDPQTGEMVRKTRLYRRMNYVNPRALNRAIRRLGGAEKIFKKIFSFNHGTAATRVRPKFRRGR